MAFIDCLRKEYERQLAIWGKQSLAGRERVWFVVYPPTYERRLRLRLPDFESSTRAAGKGWMHVDLTNAFATWMASHEYREAYFANPERLELALADFGISVAEQLRHSLESANDDVAVAVSGVGSLFGLTRVSQVVAAAADAVRGRLVIFFPGHLEGDNYRLLDAKDGWNYLAVPITCTDGED